VDDSKRFEFRDIRIRWNVLNDLYYNARHNIAPTQEHPIIVQRGDGLEARPMRWGLVPYWAKDQAIGNKMINARSETLAERPAFLLKKEKPLPSQAAVPDRKLGGGSTACRRRNAIGDFAPTSRQPAGDIGAFNSYPKDQRDQHDDQGVFN
jgi:hypothetical protein